VEEKGKLIPIKGLPPSLIHLPEGCSFRPRCAYAQDVCRTLRPPLLDVEDGHLSACHFSSRPEFLAQSEYHLVGER
jgi:oligopeptide/dipeptide ABC transporter ATP-binding protein